MAFLIKMLIDCNGVWAADVISVLVHPLVCALVLDFPDVLLFVAF